jgi:hypothetical protein
MKSRSGRPIVIVTVLLGLEIIPVSAHGPEAELTVRDIVRKAAPSVVAIEAFDKAGDLISIGTGFVVGPNRVLTNAHVITPSFSLRVFGEAPGNEADSGLRLLKFDRETDLALLEVRGFSGPALPIESGIPPVAPGDRVVVYGNIIDGEFLASDGIVRACRECEVVLSAAVHSGHSGSPLLDMQGRVIGICNSVYKAADADRMAFAVGLAVIDEFLKSPDTPRDFPAAGTSLFWPCVWKRIRGFFSAVFGWIFAAGKTLFSIYLMIATVLLFGFLGLRAARAILDAFRARKATGVPVRNSRLTYPAFAVSVMAFFVSMHAGFCFFVILFYGGTTRNAMNNIIIAVISALVNRFAWFFYRLHRPERLAAAKKGPSVLPLHGEARMTAG